MRTFIKNVLSEKGIQVSDDHLAILTHEWQALQEKKSRLKKEDLAEKAMGLRHINIGDSDE